MLLLFHDHISMRHDGVGYAPVLEGSSLVKRIGERLALVQRAGIEAVRSYGVWGDVSIRPYHSCSCSDRYCLRYIGEVFDIHFNSA